MTEQKPTPPPADSLPKEVAEYLRNLPWQLDGAEKCCVLEGDSKLIQTVKRLTFEHGIFGAYDETRPGIFQVNVEVLDEYLPGWNLPKENRRRSEAQMFQKGFAAVEHPNCSEEAAAKEWLRRIEFKAVSHDSEDIFYLAKAEEGELLQDMLLKISFTKFKRKEHDDGTWTICIDKDALKAAIGEVTVSLSKHVSQVTQSNTLSGLTP